MKNTFTLFLLLLIPSLPAGAQALRVVNTKFYCNSNPTTFEKVTDIIQTADGGFFFTGKVHKPGGGILPPCPGIGANPAMGKLDSLGNIEWIKNFCDTQVVATTVCQTPDGGYAINGGSYPLNSIAIFRYDAQGNYLWRRDFGKGLRCGTMQIINTPDNGFLLLAFTKDRDTDITVTYSYPPGIFASNDWVLIKLDSMGNKQWVKTLGTSGDENTAQVVCDGTNYYLVGFTDSKDYDCADVANHPGSTIYTIKVDSAGNVLWSRGYGGGFVNKVLYDERDGTIVVTGRSTNGRPEFPNRHGDDDFYLMKVDTAGNFKWGSMYGTPYGDLGATVCKGSNKGYFLAGHSTDINSSQYFGKLLSIDSNGKELDTHVIITGSGGIALMGIFSRQEKYWVFGHTSAAILNEGTGQNCSVTGYAGSLALTLSELKVVPLGIHQPEKFDQNFSLFPNPAHSSFEVQFDGNSHYGGKLVCTNTNGAVIYWQGVLPGQPRVPVSTAHWAPGTYVVCWQPAGGLEQQCQKMVIL